MSVHLYSDCNTNADTDSDNGAGSNADADADVDADTDTDTDDDSVAYSCVSLTSQCSRDSLGHDVDEVRCIQHYHEHSIDYHCLLLKEDLY